MVTTKTVTWHHLPTESLMFAFRELITNQGSSRPSLQRKKSKLKVGVPSSTQERFLHAQS